MDYPAGRRQFWANRLIRILHKSCAANEIGIEAVHLITVVAMVEDSTRYSKAITFWNGQLLPITGFESWGRLDRARQRAVDAGWLHYESGGRHKAGKYWAIIPPDLENVFADTQVSDDLDHHNGDGDGDQDVIETGSKRDQDVIETGSGGEPSTLPPNPNPVSADASAFIPPTRQEVTQYCMTKQNGVDAHAFVTHYESTGWRTKAGPVKSWQRCVGTFAKTAKPSPPPATGPPEGFEEFWEAFPRKEGKTAARALYVAALAMTDAANLLKGATGYGRTRKGEEAKFTKSPAKWLEEERWTDEYPGPVVPWYDLPDGSPELEKLAEEASRS